MKKKRLKKTPAHTGSSYSPKNIPYESKENNVRVHSHVTIARVMREITKKEYKFFRSPVKFCIK